MPVFALMIIDDGVHRIHCGPFCLDLLDILNKRIHALSSLLSDAALAGCWYRWHSEEHQAHHPTA